MKLVTYTLFFPCTAFHAADPSLPQQGAETIHAVEHSSNASIQKAKCVIVVLQVTTSSLETG